MIQNPGAWPNFSTELGELHKLKSRLPEYSIVFIPRSENVSSDSLVKILRSFHRDMYYIGCSIPVWFLRPPQTWVIDQPFDVKKKDNHMYISTLDNHILTLAIQSKCHYLILFYMLLKTKKGIFSGIKYLMY